MVCSSAGRWGGPRFESSLSSFFSTAFLHIWQTVRTLKSNWTTHVGQKNDARKQKSLLVSFFAAMDEEIRIARYEDGPQVGKDERGKEDYFG